MSRVEDLRSQLAEAELEIVAEEELRAARAARADSPDDPAARDAAKAAAVALREIRAARRLADSRSSVVSPGPVLAVGTTQEG